MKEWTNTWHKKLKLFYLIVSFSYLGGQKHWKINKSKQNILSWQFFTLWPKRLGFPFKFNATNPIHSKHFSPKYHSTELTGTIKTAKICTFQELSTLETSKSKPVRPLRVGDNTLWLTPDQPRVYIYVHTESYKSFSRRLSLPRELAVFFFLLLRGGGTGQGFGPKGSGRVAFGRELRVSCGEINNRRFCWFFFSSSFSLSLEMPVLFVFHDSLRRPMTNPQILTLLQEIKLSYIFDAQFRWNISYNMEITIELKFYSWRQDAFALTSQSKKLSSIPAISNLFATFLTVPFSRLTIVIWH